MKILMLTDVNSAHSYKWISSLAGGDTEIHVFSLTPDKGLYAGIKNVKVTSFNLTKKGDEPGKISYLKALPRLKKLIRQIKPDILHAHYASSYGLLGALTGFKPFIISVWGSDVYDFPQKSFIHKAILKYNLRKASAILSTSKVMAIETKKYTNKNVVVTPFGVDMDIFKPGPSKEIFNGKPVVIGTIKTLEKKYGIEFLIKAFSIVRHKNPELDIKLLIVGDGSQKNELVLLAKDLGIENDTFFAGFIPFTEVPYYHNTIDVFVALSTMDSESFGVSVVEAQSCGKPVVVSDVGGLPEVVENEKTGFIVPARNEAKAAECMEKLVRDEMLRQKMGAEGRIRVNKLFNWNNNVAQMIDIYMKITKHE